MPILAKLGNKNTRRTAKRLAKFIDTVFQHIHIGAGLHMLFPDTSHPLNGGAVTAKFTRHRIGHFANCGTLARRFNGKRQQIFSARSRLLQGV